MGMKPEPGDKVRLKMSGLSGARGIIESIAGEVMVIRLEKTRKLVRVSHENATNLSLAARKAWVSLPTRKVGRPKGLKFCDRVSVTLRIDRDLWEEFRKKESQGFIEDRTTTMNQWLRDKLAELPEDLC